MDEVYCKGVSCYTRRDAILYAIGIGCCSDTTKGGALICQNQSKSKGNRRNNNGVDATIDLRFVYEHDNDFTIFPTFPLVLPFRALVGNSSSTSMSRSRSDFFGLPSFPNDMMKNTNVIDFIRRNLIEESKLHHDTNFNIPIKVKTILHLSEKYRLHGDIQIPNVTAPTFVEMHSHLLSIKPKKIGFIVITETEYYIIQTHNHGKKILLATSQSTTLYLTHQKLHSSLLSSAIKSFHNQSYESSLNVNTANVSASISARRKWMKQHKPHRIVTQKIPTNQALLYRLSGDTNPIHVLSSNNIISTKESKSSSPLSTLPNESSIMDKPILHGLCTLGFAVRIILNYIHTIMQENEVSDGKEEKESDEEKQQQKLKLQFQYVSCQFVKPVYVGDEIEIVTWIYRYENDHQNDSSLILLFQVRRTCDKCIVVNDGILELKYGHELSFLMKELHQSINCNL